MLRTFVGLSGTHWEGIQSTLGVSKSAWGGGGAILSYVGEVSLSIAHGLSPVKLRCKGLYFGSYKDLANPT